MPIRITGMNSNLDTDTIIQELVKASSEKKTKLEKAQTKLSWKQDTWKGLNTKIHSFFKTTLDNLRFSMAYKKKATTSSNDKIASVIAGDNAVNGTQKMKVTKLSEAGYLTGGKLITADGKKATLKTKLSDLGSNGLNADGTSISVTTGGKTSNITFSSNSTIGDVVNKLTQAGVGVNFDANNQRIYVNAQKSGEKNDFSITANNMAGMNTLANLGLLTAAESGSKTEAGRWSAYQGSTDSDTLANLVAAGEVTKREAEKMKEYFSDSKNRIKENKDLRKKMADLEKKYEDVFKDQTKDIFTDPTSQKAFTEAGLTDFGSYESLADMDTAKMANVEKALVDRYNALIDLPKDNMTTDEQSAIAKEMVGLSASINKLQSAAKMKTEYQEMADKAAANETKLADNATYINELELDADGNYKIKTVTDADGNEKEVTKATGTAKLTQKTGDELVEKVNTAALMGSFDVTGTASATANRIKGENAIIELNRVEYESASNNFSINGLTITAKELTTGTEEVSIVTTDDVDGVYKVIKDFITGYNGLIKEMDSMYNAASSKGYEPLTSEEKDTMSEDEIKKWEEKIKDSILRKDSTLGTVINSMKNTMLGSFTVGGKKMTLSDFGIGTLGYFNAAENEKGMYHIDGDKEDPNTANEDDILKNLIASDPDKVTDFFTKLTSSLYDELDKQMKSTDYRSVYHVYDDKKMKKEYDAYTKKIKEAEKKLKALEDKYYKQFSNMEVALAKLQKSQSAVTSMLGG